MTEQEMEITFLRGEVINAKTRISFLLEAVKNLTDERERLIKECETYIEELMVLRKNYGFLPAIDEIVRLREALLDTVAYVSRADSLFLKKATTDALKGIPDGYC